MIAVQVEYIQSINDRWLDVDWRQIIKTNPTQIDRGCHFYWSIYWAMYWSMKWKRNKLLCLLWFRMLFDPDLATYISHTLWSTSQLRENLDLELDWIESNKTPTTQWSIFIDAIWVRNETANHRFYDYCPSLSLLSLNINWFHLIFESPQIFINLN